MAELKLKLEDKASLSQKNINLKSEGCKYILFIASHVLTEDNKSFMFSSLNTEYIAILVTNKDENLKLKSENCHVFVFDMTNESKLEKMISIIKPVKIINLKKIIKK